MIGNYNSLSKTIETKTNNNINNNKKYHNNNNK